VACVHMRPQWAVLHGHHYRYTSSHEAARGGASLLGGVSRQVLGGASRERNQRLAAGEEVGLDPWRGELVLSIAKGIPSPAPLLPATSPARACLSLPQPESCDSPGGAGFPSVLPGVVRRCPRRNAVCGKSGRNWMKLWMNLPQAPRGTVATTVGAALSMIGPDAIWPTRGRFLLSSTRPQVGAPRRRAERKTGET